MSQILSVGNVFHNKSGVKKEDNYSDVDSKSSSSEEEVSNKQCNNCQELIEHAEREREREKRKLLRLRKKPD